MLARELKHVLIIQFFGMNSWKINQSVFFEEKRGFVGDTSTDTEIGLKPLKPLALIQFPLSQTVVLVIA